LDYVAGREGEGVADPYYGGMADFERTWAEVTAGVRALARLLLEEM
jgi:protein-tyrosine phosphatase